MSYSSQEKLLIILDISKKLTSFPGRSGTIVDLYNGPYTFMKKFKEITNKWIKEDNSEFYGFLHFEEINKYFEYKFPSNKNKNPLFVLRNNSI